MNVATSWQSGWCSKRKCTNREGDKRGTMCSNSIGTLAIFWETISRAPSRKRCETFVHTVLTEKKSSEELKEQHFFKALVESNVVKHLWVFPYRDVLCEWGEKVLLSKSRVTKKSPIVCHLSALSSFTALLCLFWNIQWLQFDNWCKILPVWVTEVHKAHKILSKQNTCQ